MEASLRIHIHCHRQLGLLTGCYYRFRRVASERQILISREPAD